MGPAWSQHLPCISPAPPLQAETEPRGAERPFPSRPPFIKPKIQDRPVEIAKQLLNTDKELQGIIVDWKGTYGFIKASKGKAKHLGKIFCHVNDISNAPPKKKFRYKGAKLVFKLQRGKEEGSFKAAVVNFS